ncbi:MAG: hypothetical protein DME23_02480 [Verrucomicrobia bacterium]|nr:MAG: hypothetical protein DME23_02480 [Verrucomicrobiota bacterium]
MLWAAPFVQHSQDRCARLPPRSCLERSQHRSAQKSCLFLDSASTVGKLNHFFEETHSEISKPRHSDSTTALPPHKDAKPRLSGNV